MPAIIALSKYEQIYSISKVITVALIPLVVSPKLLEVAGHTGWWAGPLIHLKDSVRFGHLPARHGDWLFHQVTRFLYLLVRLASRIFQRIISEHFTSMHKQHKGLWLAFKFYYWVHCYGKYKLLVETTNKLFASIIAAFWNMCMSKASKYHVGLVAIPNH